MEWRISSEWEIYKNPEQTQQWKYFNNSKTVQEFGLKAAQKTLSEGGGGANQQWVPQQMLREFLGGESHAINRSTCCVWLSGLRRVTPWTSYFPRTWYSDSCLLFHWQAPAKSPEEGIFTSLLTCSWGTSFQSSSLLQQLLGGGRQFTVKLGAPWLSLF